MTGAPPSAAALAAAARLLLRSRRSFETRIRGDSMGAAIPHGTAIRIEPAAAGDLRRGDVIAYLRGEEIVAHRLLGRVRPGPRGERFAALGDGNWFPDEFFDAPALLGRVAAIDCGSGWREVPDARARPPGMRVVARLTLWWALGLLPLRDRLARARR